MNRHGYKEGVTNLKLVYSFAVKLSFNGNDISSARQQPLLPSSELSVFKVPFSKFGFDIFLGNSISNIEATVAGTTVTLTADVFAIFIFLIFVLIRCSTGLLSNHLSALL